MRVLRGILVLLTCSASGLGPGLFVCRQIAEFHGGTVSVGPAGAPRGAGAAGDLPTPPPEPQPPV